MKDVSVDQIIEGMREASTKDVELVRRAYAFATKAHEGQKRYSGDPYMEHLAHTALILAELNADKETIAAGLLHDTIEDGKATEAEVRRDFGDDILFLVQGVTKLGKLHYHGLKRHVESLRKLFLAMAQDRRVIVIRLADRLHNMRTLDAVPDEKKRQRIALETLEIYAPIAHRLNMGRVKGELEDLAFPYILPKEYAQVHALLETKVEENIERLGKITKTLRKKLAEQGIRDVRVDYRVKHIYSLYEKLQKYDMDIEKVYDIAALRIITKSVEECYKILGIVHSVWKPFQGRIKDYIASPKTNGYQSIHTTVFTGDGGIFEIQIRTEDMHRYAEFGFASHVLYKEGTAPGADQSVAWIHRLAETQKDIKTPELFIKTLQEDFFRERIFVFTPKGEVVDLPQGAGPIDFAYTIHTDIGDHISGAKINGKMATLHTVLQSGDIVEIETKKNSKPSSRWLPLAKTTLARKKIRAAIQS